MKKNTYFLLSISLISALFLITIPVNAAVNVNADDHVLVTADINRPLSRVNYIDDNSGASNVPLDIYDIQFINGTGKVHQISINPILSGAVATGYHLFLGSNEVQFQNATSGQMVFTNLESNQQTDNNIYTVSADLSSTTSNNSNLVIALSGVEVRYHGNIYPVTVNVSNSNPQYFFHAVPNLTFQSSSFVKGSTTTSSTFNFTMTPVPGSAIAPTADDFNLIFKNQNTGSSTIITDKNLTINPTPIDDLLNANQTYTITLNGVVANPNPSTDIYKEQITTASTTVQDSSGNWINIFQTYGLEKFITSKIGY